MNFIVMGIGAVIGYWFRGTEVAEKTVNPLAKEIYETMKKSINERKNRNKD